MQKPPSVAKQGLVRIPNKPCLATGLCNRQSRLPVKMIAKYTSCLGDFKNIPCLATLFLPCDQPSWWIIIALFSWRCDHLGRKQFDQNPQLRHFFVDDSGTSKQTNEVRLLPQLLQEQFFSWSWVCLLVCFRCPEPKCNSHFFTEKALDKHVNMRHKKTVQDGTGVMCDTCGKILRNQVGWKIYTFLRLGQILALRVKS